MNLKTPARYSSFQLTYICVIFWGLFFSRKNSFHHTSWMQILKPRIVEVEPQGRCVFGCCDSDLLLSVWSASLWWYELFSRKKWTPCPNTGLTTYIYISTRHTLPPTWIPSPLPTSIMATEMFPRIFETSIYICNLALCSRLYMSQGHYDKSWPSWLPVPTCNRVCPLCE